MLSFCPSKGQPKGYLGSCLQCLGVSKKGLGANQRKSEGIEGQSMDPLVKGYKGKSEGPANQSERSEGWLEGSEGQQKWSEGLPEGFQGQREKSDGKPVRYES